MSAVLIVSLILTAWSGVTLWLIGTPKHAGWGFAAGIACQALWVAFDLMTGAYGLLPLALVYGPLYARGWRNHRNMPRLRIVPVTPYEPGRDESHGMEMQ